MTRYGGFTRVIVVCPNCRTRQLLSRRGLCAMSACRARIPRPVEVTSGGAVAITTTATADVTLAVTPADSAAAPLSPTERTQKAAAAVAIHVDSFFRSWTQTLRSRGKRAAMELLRSHRPQPLPPKP